MHNRSAENRSISEEFAAKVVIPGLPTPLYYIVPPSEELASVGAQVSVPLGNSSRNGWIIGLSPLKEALGELGKKQKDAAKSSSQLSLIDSSELSSKLKPISKVTPAFSKELLPLFEWMATYYGVSLAEVIENAIPKAAHARQLKFVQLSELGKEKAGDNDWLEARGKKASLQRKVIEHLSSANTSVALSELKSLGASFRNAVKKLEQEALLSIKCMSPFDVALKTDLSKREEAPELMPSQKTAVEKINDALDKKSFKPFLLYGVTGSGKTEVYIRAINRVVEEGGSALVIVPEIALTPQLVDRFQSRLSTPLSILHSQVGASERWHAWNMLLNGESRVAVGARSAIFAPLKDLSLIIVDEEHEHTYKQSDGLRYNARDVALVRAKQSNCPVVLGSATPSFESLFNVKQGRYGLLEMPERISDRPLPSIEIVELAKIKKKEMPSENISPRLHESITRTLAAKEQVIILFNRRGFSSYLQCDTCGEVVQCPNCSVAFTYHKHRHTLLCHYCDLKMRPPQHCQVCRNDNTTKVEIEDETKLEKVGILEHRGGGTEKVVEELAELFPDANIDRMDRDTVGGKDSYRTILDAVRRGDTDILVGTQMLAKGHDLPGVTLVGIIDPDVGLNLPDFRSSERVYQLITQAAGRAGRGEVPGNVIVQTRQANHPTIVATVTGRFKAFARFEIDQRKLLGYPPWGSLLRLVISSTDLERAHKSAVEIGHVTKDLVQKVSDEDNPVHVLGPTTAPLERLRGRYRWNILLKSPSKKKLSQIAGSLSAWKSQHLNPNARLTIDVDPFDML